MDTLNVISSIVEEITKDLIMIQDYLIEHYEEFKGQVVTVRLFGGDIIYDVDSIYETYKKWKK